ncbi:MAG: 50S ribosomal protein L9 [Acidobacteriota bacterium]
MKLILREDVPHLGRQGDVVSVADGYARNFLLPNRLAYRLTPGVQRQIEIERRARQAREERERATAETLAAQLRELDVLRFSRRVGETGQLYGSVTNADIAAALEERGIEVPRRQIRLDEPIKQVGTHHVAVHVGQDLDVELVVEVEPEEDGSA